MKIKIFRFQLQMIIFFIVGISFVAVIVNICCCTKPDPDVMLIKALENKIQNKDDIKVEL